MIQIQPQKPSSVQPQTLKQALPDSFIIGKIFYTILLASLILAMCFYFDLFEDYDLVSMIFGFLVCIILQFTLLSYYFQEDMQKMKMDEIGVIRDKIRLVFGELNQKELQKKIRMKYYRREASEEDKLFQEGNDKIYQNVMTYLRSKEEPNFNELINKVKGKWLSLQHKISIIQDFLAGMLKLEQSKKLLYQKHKNRLKRVVDSEQYKDLAHILSEELIKSPIVNIQNLQNTTAYYSQDQHVQGTLQPDESKEIIPLQKNNLLYNLSTAQKILNGYMLQKARLVQKEAADLKERVIQQFGCYAQTVHASSLENSKKREKLYEDYRASEDEKNRNLRELQKIAFKITDLSTNLQERQVEGGEIELILKKQFELRLLKIESENLLIKLSKASSSSLSNSEKLYEALEDENVKLQRYLQVLNGKINLYRHEMAGYGEKRAPSFKRQANQKEQQRFEMKKQQEKAILKKQFQEISFKTIFIECLDNDVKPDQLYSKIITLRNKEGAFLGHLDQLAKIFQQLKQQHSKARSTILSIKNQLEDKQNQFIAPDRGGESRAKNYSIYFASTINDQKLAHMFEEVADIEVRHNQKMKSVLKEQLQAIRKFQKDKGSRLKHVYEQYKRKEAQCEMVSDKGRKQYEDSRTQLIQCIKEYCKCNKFNNFLPQIMQVIYLHEEDYLLLAFKIDEEEVFQLKQNKSSDQDKEKKRKEQKYAAFSSCFSPQCEDTIDERLAVIDNRELLQEKTPQVLKSRFLIDIWKEKNERQHVQSGRVNRESKQYEVFRYEESNQKSLAMVNRILNILFNQWKDSEFFHELIKEELLISLNRKKPDIVEHLRIDFFRIIEKDQKQPPFKNLRVHSSQIYRCLFDFTLNFKGKIAVKIGSRLKIGSKPELEVKLMIKEFFCPIRVCFTPFSIGKSYVSLLEKPKINIEYKVRIGTFQLTSIPLFTQFIKIYAVLKLRKKFLWPKRMTLSLPLAFKSSLDLAIQQRNNFEKERQRLGKKSK